MNHDLIGIKDLLKRQKQQINRIKFFTRIDNEKYLREHPEIEFIIQQFLVKLLEDQPKNCIKDAGKFFHTTNFKELYKNNYIFFKWVAIIQLQRLQIKKMMKIL